MDRFPTVRDAKEFLIRQIIDEADRDGVSLSEVERKMLYFSETGWTLPNMMAISHDFDQHYDQVEYESKIGQIIRRIDDQPGIDRNEWQQAVQRLREEDHYLLVLIDRASRTPVKASRWDTIKFILAGALVVALFLPILSFIHSHVASLILSKWVGQGTLLALVILVAFLANRGKRRSA
jgi:hypothetical protein